MEWERCQIEITKYMDMKNYFLLLIFSISFLSVQQAQAQCNVSNTFFQAGEQLNFDLYLKYGLINTKAGTTTLNIASDKYNGKDALRMRLVAKTTGAAGSIFPLSDTLTTYMSPEIAPLRYSKRAHEDSDVNYEDVYYTYTPSGVNLRSKRVKNGENRFDKNMTHQGCIYDMMSIIFYARTLDYSTMKKGSQVSMNYIEGTDIKQIAIRYLGTEKMKANDGKNYNCLVLSLIIKSGDTSKFEDKNEAMRVYVTNDQNRMPVRLDIKLKRGSTRAILRSYKGNKHKVEIM